MHTKLILLFGFVTDPKILQKILRFVSTEVYSVNKTRFNANYMYLQVANKFSNNFFYSIRVKVLLDLLDNILEKLISLNGLPSAVWVWTVSITLLGSERNIYVIL